MVGGVELSFEAGEGVEDVMLDGGGCGEPVGDVCVRDDEGVARRDGILIEGGVAVGEAE
jgi:hypothetical protein